VTHGAVNHLITAITFYAPINILKYHVWGGQIQRHINQHFDIFIEYYLPKIWEIENVIFPSPVFVALHRAKQNINWIVHYNNSPEAIKCISSAAVNKL
jgi:hypothetical protein